MRCILAGTALALLSLSVIAVAQNQPLKFEAASVKPSQQSGSRFSGQTCHGTDSKYAPSAPLIPPLGRCLLVRSTLKDAINQAYSLDLSYRQIDERIKGGPSWADTDRFEVEAKADDSSVTVARLREMLQNLLADRFRLQVHRQTKEVQVYALVIAKGGAKLVASKTGNEHTSTIGHAGKITGRNATLTTLIRVLNAGGAVDGPVVDRSGLTGKYDFTLSWTPDTRTPNNTDPHGSSLFTALQEQLGLRLQPEKGTVEIIVIDHADKPDAN